MRVPAFMGLSVHQACRLDCASTRSALSEPPDLGVAKSPCALPSPGWLLVALAIYAAGDVRGRRLYRRVRRDGRIGVWTPVWILCPHPTLDEYGGCGLCRALTPPNHHRGSRAGSGPGTGSKW